MGRSVLTRAEGRDSRRRRQPHQGRQSPAGDGSSETGSVVEPAGSRSRTSPSAFITGWSIYLPNLPVGNDRIESVLGELKRQPSTVKRRVLLANGIETRYYAIDPQTGAMTHTNAELTAEAIRRLCRDFDVSISDIESLVCGSSSPDQILPSHGSMVHAQLGCPPCEVATISGVCSSSVSALKYGALNVAAGAVRNAVVTGSELASPSLRASHLDAQTQPESDSLSDHPLLPFRNEFLRWMLSDGAAAVLVAPSPRIDGPSLRIDWVDICSYANESDVCMYAGMQKKSDGTTEGYRTISDGQTLIRDGYLSLAQDVRVLESRLPALLEKATRRMIDAHALAAEDVDWLLPHYSSNWFRQRLFDGLANIGFGIPWDRWFSNLTSKGNTGSAAILIMLEELMSSGRTRVGDRILCIVPESSRMTFGFVYLTVV